MGLGEINAAGVAARVARDPARFRHDISLERRPLRIGRQADGEGLLKFLEGQRFRRARIDEGADHAPVRAPVRPADRQNPAGRRRMNRDPGGCGPRPRRICPTSPPTE